MVFPKVPSSTLAQAGAGKPKARMVVGAEGEHWQARSLLSSTPLGLETAASVRRATGWEVEHDAFELRLYL